MGINYHEYGNILYIKQQNKYLDVFINVNDSIIGNKECGGICKYVNDSVIGIKVYGAKQYRIIDSHPQHQILSNSTKYTSKHSIYLTNNRIIARKKPAIFYSCCTVMTDNNSHTCRKPHL